MKPAIDSARLSRELDELGAISEAAPPVVTRVVFTEADRLGRAFVNRLCVEAGLEIRSDAVGNTFARWRGGYLAESDYARAGPPKSDRIRL